MKELINLLNITNEDISEIYIMCAMSFVICVFVVVLFRIKRKLDREKYGDKTFYILDRLCRAIRYKK